MEIQMDEKAWICNPRLANFIVFFIDEENVSEGYKNRMELYHPEVVLFRNLKRSREEL